MAGWGEIVRKSNENGPFRLVLVQSDGHEMTAHALSSYGIEGVRCVGHIE